MLHCFSIRLITWRVCEREFEHKIEWRQVFPIVCCLLLTDNECREVLSLKGNWGESFHLLGALGFSSAFASSGLASAAAAIVVSAAAAASSFLSSSSSLVIAFVSAVAAGKSSYSETVTTPSSSLAIFTRTFLGGCGLSPV